MWPWPRRRGSGSFHAIPLYCNSSCCLVTHHSRLLSQLSGLFWVTGPLAVTLHPLLGLWKLLRAILYYFRETNLGSWTPAYFQITCYHRFYYSYCLLPGCTPRGELPGGPSHRGPDRKRDTHFLSVSTMTRKFYPCLHR